MFAAMIELSREMARKSIREAEEQKAAFETQRFAEIRVALWETNARLSSIQKDLNDLTDFITTPKKHE